MARHLNDPHGYVSVAAAHGSDELPGSQPGIAVSTARQSTLSSA